MIEHPDGVFLTPAHLYELRCMEAELKLARAHAENKRLAANIMGLQAQAAVTKLKEEEDSFRSEVRSREARLKGFSDELCVEYGIEGELEFNPDTGQLNTQDI